MTRKAQEAFQHLHEISKSASTLSSIMGLLNWDQETYMPPGAIDARSSQIAHLASLIHKEKTGPKFGNALKKLIDIKSKKVRMKGLTQPQIAALREWLRDYIQATKIPNSFVKTFSEVTSKATAVWMNARKKNKFSLFAPHLQKIVDLNREKAEILGYKNHPYDALIDSFEPEMTTAKLDTLFSKLKKDLSSLISKILSQPSIDTSIIEANYPHTKQIQFGNQLLNALKLDRSYSRLDESTHPFSIGIHPKDVRLTTRLDKKFLLSNILSIMHEAGHSIYERGLPEEHFGTPLCEAVSLGIHESQSRWWETLIGRSFPFWQYFYPILQKTFPSQLKKVSLEEFYKAIHKVESSLIRVEADEVTYCMHIILRFEIEKDLIKGKIDVKDIPDVWNSSMQKFLKIKPKNDQNGCLQDIHWSMGVFGYFPTYALGNLYAAHFFQSFQKKFPDWEKRVSQGEFGFIREWLKDNIHQYGRFYSAEELAKKVTGKFLSEKAYIQYLNGKYSKIYGF